MATGVVGIHLIDEVTTVDGKAKSASHYLDSMVETIVCRYLQGNHPKPGFLRWCRISSIHSMSNHQFECGGNYSMLTWVFGLCSPGMCLAVSDKRVQDL